jgi:DNA (cytosine-5)-methyltransferase 1
LAAYYNEIDPYAAQWLRNLIQAGHIAPGDVDERSIVDVRADDLRGYEQAHFFAGLGGWSYALRLAGWPDERPVWTGSCPCQPWSNAGTLQGMADARHLWPAWAKLIEKRRPAIVFGEQVASAVTWLRLVKGDMEALDYAVAAIPMEAACVGAPSLRDRIYFMADAQGGGRYVPKQDTANTFWRSWSSGTSCFVSRGIDGTVRRTEPGISFLANGISDLLEPRRAYGNAIVPQVAAEFIAAAAEALNDGHT